MYEMLKTLDYENLLDFLVAPSHDQFSQDWLIYVRKNYHWTSGWANKKWSHYSTVSYPNFYSNESVIQTTKMQW